MKVQVFDTKGTSVKEINLNDAIWGIEPHQQAMYDAVVAQQSAMRQGTHKVKTRTEVSGGGRKPWRQKGTGRARQGSIRAPQWKGGGIVFGPTPDKNYIKHVNRKVRKLAIKSALSLKAKESNLVIVDQFALNEPSTKTMVEILANLKVNNEKLLIVTKPGDEVIVKSSRNIEKVNIIPSDGINIYDLLNANKLLVTEEVIKTIEEVYA
ncbi:50S ribosomal protein L4 [Spiroplasma mirum ATCC 29335]|uniref:Large ribosomal subunit protein uL4 n=1 Tax=Spiroplasma mirum ATCC 29335 TaxID=838561 RepID=W0GKM8_9MOLU|nr:MULTISPECIES: 50S ribosomal protein L4 [Spiroplasma]AHF60727.1 50S ribosomal protein L4 [Spiroplasma mirum ATCC 29335]AHI57698.1 50S ribosomal protein L4 [Spiroplasma mirum ATCC 29335]AKM52845.1 50S ribosomal protein L4 [Spiroplasma atrichopogonis]